MYLYILYKFMHVYVNMNVFVYISPWPFYTRHNRLDAFIYGVATMSKRLKIVGLFCKISSLL